jgi:hypothetical protein
MLEGFLISIPGITCLLLLFAGIQLWRRRAHLRIAEANGSCKLCGTPFVDAHIEFAGRVTRTERARLDRFQARFASFKILCHECGTMNICASDGTAFKAMVQREE